MKYILAGLLVSILLATYFLNFLTGTAKTVFVLFLYLAIALLVILSSISLNDIGLSIGNLKQGILWALPFMALILVGGVIMLFVAPDAFKDTRYNLSTGTTAFYVLLVIPFITVVIEELVFRGMLLGVLRSLYSDIAAVIVSSIAFGVWHVYSAGGVKLGFLPAAIAEQKLITVIMVIIATALAGMFFAWLRLKSGSLMAPILVHWMINSTGVLLAYISWRT